MGLPNGELLQNLASGVAIGAPIAGGFAEADAARAQGSAAAAAARYNAELARMEGAAEAARVRRAGRRELGRQRTILGASGVRLEGSPLDVLAANAYEIEREAVLAGIAGRNTARLEQARGRSAERAGRVSARTALLGGLAQGAGTGLQLGLRRRGA